MKKSAVISTRIESELKHRAERVFKELGLTTSQFVFPMMYPLKLWKRQGNAKG